MKLSIAIEARFLITSDRKVWSESAPDYSFWQRYLDVFDSVEVIARMQNVSSVATNCERADGKGVRFIPLPYYIGPTQYLRNSLKIQKIIKNVIKSSEAVVLRTPGQISNCVFRELKKINHPFGVEVVGDPHDVFAPGVVEHPFRPFFRWWETKKLREHCKSALVASYVTEKILQKRYPNPHYSIHFSSIDIGGEAYAPTSRSHFGNNGAFSLAFVGSLAQLYKAPDVLIDAVALCINEGLKVKLKIVGDGKFRGQLEEQATRLRLDNSVVFLGQLPPGEPVRNELLTSDLFILPSRTEGLPRAMIEAMACGLPCIGTNVGGIPELLAVDDLVPSGNAQMLARKIKDTLADVEQMKKMSVRNLRRAMDYRKDLLDQKRRMFYSELQSKTECWLREKKTPR